MVKARLATFIKARRDVVEDELVGIAMGTQTCKTFHHETTPSRHLEKPCKPVFTSLQLHMGLHGLINNNPALGLLIINLLIMWGFASLQRDKLG